jgi:sensor domain CHASE-containing protein
MPRRRLLALAVIGVWLVAGPLVWAQQYSHKEQAELVKALKEVKISLGEGLSASEREGQPISGQFEVEDKELQLSVYTMKKGTFSEVTVNHKTGTIAEVEPITSDEDLAAAKMQAQAMTQAKQSLRAVVDKAVNANQGFRAVSIVPTLKDGHPVAEVTLVKDGTFKTVTETLE